MKKIFFTLIAFLSFNTYADEQHPTSGNDCGEHCSWKIEEGVLSVTGYGDMKNYNDICSQTCYADTPWYWDRENITKVVIENEEGTSGFISIGNNAFARMNYTEAVLPEGLKKIGNQSFLAGNLEKINFPDSIEEIGHGAFLSSKISELNLPSSLKKLGGSAFASTPIHTIVVPENITEIDPQAFYCPRCASTQAGLAMPLEKLYCTKAQMTQCEAATTWFGDNVKILEYKRFGDSFYVDGKFYQHPNDILSDNHILKRIYTIDEANKVTGTKNRVSIKYR